jgi:hypothetical protein
VSEADSFDWLPALLVLQGVLATLDSLRTPYRHRRLRDALYAALLLGFAWLAWHGAFAWVPGALLAALVAIGALDERAHALHSLLLVNLGAIAALLLPSIVALAANPTELAPAHHGWMSWALTGLGLVAAFNAARRAGKR